jgi:phosphate starvation-inducible PhoH-like protein
LKSQPEDISVKKISFADNTAIKVLFGEHDRNIKLIERLEKVKLYVKGNEVSISGDVIGVDIVEKLLIQLYSLIKKGYPIYHTDIDYAHRILSENGSTNIEEIFLDTVFISSNKRNITPKSIAQKLYIESMRNCDMVFGIGPAGTGKTYLAMALAVAFLLEKKVHRIVLTRPALEAGEKLGFLPGDLSEKVNPYLRPLYDALYDMVDFDRASALINKGVIEVAPLAFMRGRTLNDSFIILDEAQNTTSEQMKMFLTRLGFGFEVEKILKKTEGIKFVYFSEVDVVRHSLVQDIIRAYNHLDRSKGGS